MTLCVVWRDDSGRVHLASDSRITVKSSTEDVAVKVTRLQCEVFPPSSELDSGTGHYALTIGIAFAGNHLNANVIKESLVEVLSRLQYIPNKTHISMDRVAKIAFWAYESLSKKVCSIPSIGRTGICGLFITGYCPEQKKTRIFRFSTSPQNRHSYSEVLVNPGVELMGSGEAAARASTHYPKNPVQMLLEVIDDVAVPTVGGALQYARHHDTHLSVYAAWQLDTDVRYMRGGLDINDFISRRDDEDFFIAPLIFDPRPEAY